MGIASERGSNAINSICTNVNNQLENFNQTINNFVEESWDIHNREHHLKLHVVEIQAMEILVAEIQVAMLLA